MSSPSQNTKPRLEPSIHFDAGFVTSNWIIKPLKGKRKGYQFRLHTGEVLFTCFPAKTFSPEIAAANIRLVLAAPYMHDMMEEVWHNCPLPPPGERDEWWEMEETLGRVDHLLKWLVSRKGNAQLANGEWAGGPIDA
jgi:hypothetical protein